MIVRLVLVRSIQYCNCVKPFSVTNILFERLSFSIERGKGFRIDCSGNEPTFLAACHQASFGIPTCRFNRENRSLMKITTKDFKSSLFSLVTR